MSAKTAVKDSTAKFRGQHKSAWNFWKHGISFSKIALFLACREQMRLTAVEGYEPRQEKLPFLFGNAGHEILRRMRGRKTRPAPKLIQKYVREYEGMWLKDHPRPTVKERENLELTLGQLSPLLVAYADRWEGDWTKGAYAYGNNTAKPKTWHRLEEWFRIPWVYDDGAATRINGIWDGVFRSPGARFWVLDTKFKSRIDDGTLLDLMPTDLQLNLYLWACGQMFHTPPAGGILDVVRRPQLRRGVKESLKEFLARCRADVSDVQRYDHHFIRFEIQVTPQEIRDWALNTLAPIMEDVRAWWDGRAPHYMNPGALVNQYGRCDMYGPLVNGDFSQVCKRKARKHGKS